MADQRIGCVLRIDVCLRKNFHHNVYFDENSDEITSFKKLTSQPITTLVKYLYITSLIQVLDAVLGHNDSLFRRQQLKALVSIHSQEVPA